jgi:MFS family permease
MRYVESAPTQTGGPLGAPEHLTSHVFVSGQGRQGRRLGFLGSLAVGVVFLLGLVLFLLALAVIAVVFVAAIVVALVALGVNRLMMALSPRYRERRQAQGHFQPTVRIIETTAKVIDSTKPRRRS